MPRQKRDVERLVESADVPDVAEYRMPGRPPRNPMDKVGQPIRFLVTIRTLAQVDAGATMHNLIQSDYLRLALYRQLQADGLLPTEEHLTDPTWDQIRLAGLA